MLAELGLAAMKSEEQGPNFALANVVKVAAKARGEDSDSDEDEAKHSIDGQEYDPQILRKYEASKLKWFYVQHPAIPCGFLELQQEAVDSSRILARSLEHRGSVQAVVDCDSIATAEAIYKVRPQPGWRTRVRGRSNRSTLTLPWLCRAGVRRPGVRHDLQLQSLWIIPNAATG